MSKRISRALLSISLIAVMVAFLLPPATATANSGEPGQTSSRTSQSTDKTKRREPPPFDRPPLSSGDSNSTNETATSPPKTSPTTTSRRGNSTSQPGSTSSSTRPNDSRTRPTDPDEDSVNGTDIDNPNAARTNQPPVMRRPTDSRSGNPEPQPRTKPVLRRPGDPDPATDPRPAEDERPRRQSGGQAGDDEIIRLDSTLVNIPVLVSDRSGRYVPRLRANDFYVYEDGEQQEVAFFGDEMVPFNVVLLLDVSPSVNDSQTEIRNAALEFIRQMRANDRVMIVSFDRTVHYLTDFTSNRRDLEAAIQNVRIGDGTSVYDAVYDVVARRLNSLDGRKALILLSDGEDTTSRRASYDSAVDLVEESDVLVYGIRYPGTNVNMRRTPNRDRDWDIPQIRLPFPWPRRRGGNFADSQSNLSGGGKTYATPAPQWSRRGGQGDFMADITTAGGGPVYDAEKIADLSRLTSRIAEELRHVYVLSYYPTNSLTNGGYRSIRIRVRGRDDIAVRHRRGYNARDFNARPGN